MRLHRLCVRVRLGTQVNERIAVRVADRRDYERVREALEAKYGIAPGDRDPDREIWIFRLDSRE